MSEDGIVNYQVNNGDNGGSNKNITVKAGTNEVTFTYDHIVNVTVQYLDKSTGEPVHESYTHPQVVGSDYTATAENIDGYTADEPTKSMNVKDDNSNIIFYYSKNTETTPTDPDDGGSTTDPDSNKADLTVKYVDENNKEIAGATTLSAQEVGKDVTVTAKDITGYDLTSDATKSVTVDKDSNNNVVVFTYKAKETPVDPATNNADVIVHYIDESGKTLSEDTKTNLKIGSNTTVNAKDINGYTVNGDKTQNVTVSKNGNEITFTYTKDSVPVQQSTITTKFLDENGNEIADSITDKVDNGKSYTANAKTIDGYTLSGDTSQSIDSVTGDKTLTFVYTKNVVPAQKSTITTKFVDEAGKELSASKTESVDNGTSFKVNAPEIVGYTVKGETTQSIDSVNGDKTLTFTYSKDAIPAGELQYKISYIGLNGNLAGGESEDDYYQIHAPVEGTASKTNRFVNLTGDILDIPGYELDSNFDSKDDLITNLSNYIVSDDPSSNIIDIHYVSTKQPITVHYVDEDGNKIAPDVTDHWYTDDKRQVPYSKITGYYVKDVAKETYLTVKPGQNEISVHYTKNPVVTAEELENKMLLLVNDYRKENNVSSPMAFNDLLVAGSKTRSDEEAEQIAKSGDIYDFDHERPDGSMWNTEPNLNQYRIGDYSMAENIAVGQGLTADEIAQDAFDALISDKEHRDNIINDHSFDIGMGAKQVGEYEWVIVQDFGGKFPDSVWDANDYNTASATDLGYTQLDVSNSAKYFNDDLFNTNTTKNSYVSDHIFKSRDDAEKWESVVDAGGTKVSNSIWSKGGTDAKLTVLEVLNYHTGALIGYVPVITNMDKPSQDYLDDGATTWF
ncbi:hypothetical protein D1B17_06145 [Companilactobacillus zhachilii]|uniref:SCP domain-containing protein n=1 Tax=Companilactobacillus zhachilii TaxID=2304606 RepID=A0A386PUA6_9LACO|nr:MucBP domain-containing protein [Companilactobacillus zhachilii]AYE38233.1 hypothetical protein D1B17_06145 [Companilactobacillus zhachilii]